MRLSNLFGLLLIFIPAALAQRPDPARIHRYETQHVAVPDFEAEGYILDIGGGGEGVIGQLKPKQVIAIDLIKRELEEAPAGPLKIIMDATDLKFLDNSFHTATAFFSFMYMKPEIQVKAMAEAYRVLAPGGRFLLWEVSLPVQFDKAKDIAVFPIEAKLPATLIKTGYGTFFPPAAHDQAYFIKMAEAAGFKVEKQSTQERHLYLELRKPAAK